MDEETKAIATGVGILASAIGLWEFLRRRHQATLRDRLTRDEIIRVLGRIEKIDKQLEETIIRHPEETFHTADQARRQHEIMARLDRIEAFVRERSK